MQRREKARGSNDGEERRRKEEEGAAGLVTWHDRDSQHGATVPHCYTALGIL